MEHQRETNSRVAARSLLEGGGVVEWWSGGVAEWRREANRMNQQLDIDTLTGENLARIEKYVRCRLGGRVREFQLIVHEYGLVLRGRARTFYVKQLAQHAVMETTSLSIRANEIDVL